MLTKNAVSSSNKKPSSIIDTFSYNQNGYSRIYVSNFKSPTILYIQDRHVHTDGHRDIARSSIIYTKIHYTLFTH